MYRMLLCLVNQADREVAGNRPSIWLCTLRVGLGASLPRLILDNQSLRSGCALGPQAESPGF